MEKGLIYGALIGLQAYLYRTSFFRSIIELFLYYLLLFAVFPKCVLPPLVFCVPRTNHQFPAIANLHTMIEGFLFSSLPPLSLSQFITMVSHLYINGHNEFLKVNLVGTEIPMILGTLQAEKARIEP